MDLKWNRFKYEEQFPEDLIFVGLIPHKAWGWLT